MISYFFWFQRLFVYIAMYGGGLQPTTSTSKVSSNPSSTRSSATKPFIGHSRPDIPARRLPTPEDVLRVLSHYREQPRCNKKGPLTFCCPIIKDNSARCLKAGGCGEREEPCLQLKATLPYRQAGIITISDRAIQKRILDLSEEFRKVSMKRNIQTPGIVASRDTFLEKISHTWDITDSNARQTILNDEARTQAAKEEDLAFFDDYFGPGATRKWTMAGRDEDYDRELLESLLSKEAFENREQERARKTAARKEKVNQEAEKRLERVAESVEQEDDDDDHGEVGDQEEQDKDWKVSSGLRKSKKRKSSGDGDGEPSDDDEEGIWLRVPKDILKLTAPAAVRNRGLY